MKFSLGSTLNHTIPSSRRLLPVPRANHRQPHRRSQAAVDPDNAVVPEHDHVDCDLPRVRHHDRAGPHEHEPSGLRGVPPAGNLGADRTAGSNVQHSHAGTVPGAGRAHSVREELFALPHLFVAVRAAAQDLPPEVHDVC